MTLSMVVSIPDLVYTYMECMETASSNLHASGLTYSPQGAPFVYSEALIIRNVTANAQRPWFDASVNRRLIRTLAGGKNHRIKTEPARMSFLFFSSVISKLI